MVMKQKQISNHNDGNLIRLFVMFAYLKKLAYYIFVIVMTIV